MGYQIILNEVKIFSSEIKETLYNVIDEYDPCDFDSDVDYAEAIVDYTLGRIGYDSLDEESFNEYNELMEIILNNFAEYLFSIYETSCLE
jgi:hypothetical protein